jgi:stage II sporulation protein M
MKKEFLNALKNIRDSKNYIYGGIILFIITTLIGYFFPIFFTEEIKELLKNLVLSFENLNTLQIILKIFLNNSLVSFSIILLGLLLGLFPLFAIIQNGYILGFVIKNVILKEGFIVLWRLLPHGIFELPAIFISMGLGIRLGWKVIQRDNPWKFLKDSLETFFLVIIPLLVLAAIIEGLLIGL